jgi:hypothetical protein
MNREQELIEQANVTAWGGLTRAQLQSVRPAIVPPVVTSAPGPSPTLEQVFALGRVRPSYRSWISGAPNEIVRPSNAPQQGGQGGYSGGLRNATAGW